MLSLALRQQYEHNGRTYEIAVYDCHDGSSAFLWEHVPLGPKGRTLDPQLRGNWHELPGPYTAYDTAYKHMKSL